LVLPYENIQLCLTDTCYLEGIGWRKSECKNNSCKDFDTIPFGLYLHAPARATLCQYSIIKCNSTQRNSSCLRESTARSVQQTGCWFGFDLRQGMRSFRPDLHPPVTHSVPRHDVKMST
jgi:hypothetical protein